MGAEYDEYGLPVPSIRGTLDEEPAKNKGGQPKGSKTKNRASTKKRPGSLAGRPRKTDEERKKTGPKPVYDPKFCEVAKGVCAEMGATDQHLAKIFGVDKSTIARWKRMHSDFRDAVCAGKDEWDSNHVEGALCKRATGYEFEETTQEWDEKTQAFVTVKKVLKHIPGDVGAQRFWLANRRKERWQESRRIDGTMTMRLTHEEMLDQLEGKTVSASIDMGDALIGDDTDVLDMDIPALPGNGDDEQ